MLQAIRAARESVRLEMYIFSRGRVGDSFLVALIEAAQRGVRVRVLVDGLGSYLLPFNYWDPLRAAGGEARIFNPLSLGRIGIRNHRKMLVCDERLAFVGGFNIADEYDGDGVTQGWRDLGIKMEGEMARELAGSFDEIFGRAEFRHKWLVHLRKPTGSERSVANGRELLVSGPGRGHNPIRAALRRDLAPARDVRIVVAYFLPSWRMRRQLMRVARRGGRVQLVLAGKSDVRLSRWASRSLYRRLLRSGIEIYEYQPQILHAKLYLIDRAVYVGSANLDLRSLRINYELMVRFEEDAVAEQARAIFEDCLAHCRCITLEDWIRSRTLWRRLKQRWAYWLLVRLDPYLARRQWLRLPD